MISGKCNAGGSPAMNEHHIQGGVLIVLVVVLVTYCLSC